MAHLLNDKHSRTGVRCMEGSAFLLRFVESKSLDLALVLLHHSIFR